MILSVSKRQAAILKETMEKMLYIIKSSLAEAVVNDLTEETKRLQEEHDVLVYVIHRL